MVARAPGGTEMLLGSRCYDGTAKHSLGLVSDGEHAKLGDNPSPSQFATNTLLVAVAGDVANSAQSSRQAIDRATLNAKAHGAHHRAHVSATLFKGTECGTGGRHQMGAVVIRKEVIAAPGTTNHSHPSLSSNDTSALNSPRMNATDE